VRIRVNPNPGGIGQKSPTLFASQTVVFFGKQSVKVIGYASQKCPMYIFLTWTFLDLILFSL
jgi:hypothetical protein